MKGNEALKIPSHIIASTKPWELYPFLFPSHENLSINEAKLTFLGEGGVGKTTLVNLLKHGFDSFHEPPLTQGVDLSIDKKIWKTKAEDNHPINVNIWDFGGQDYMQTAHRFFLTPHSVYALVLDAQKAFSPDG